MVDAASGVEIVVTKHAEKRARERVGLKRSAVQRTARKAWVEGVVSSNHGHGGVRADVTVKAHIGWHWIFHVDGPLRKLVTVVPRGPRGPQEDEDRAARRERMSRMGRRFGWNK